MTALRTLLLTLWLIAAPTGVAAIELPEPAARGEPALPPGVVEDSSRLPDAPSALAIDTTAEEDGAAAGLRLAERALQASRVAYGPADARLIVPLTNAAALRQRAGDTVGALRDYRAAVALGESQGGPRDSRLFGAWYGMGYTHLAARQYDAAAAALETALQLHRINQGLYSEAQLDVLHALALAVRAQGRAEDADELQVRRLQVAERVLGLGTPEIAQRYLVIGRWFRNVGRPGDALALQALAVTVLQKGSKDDPRLIDPLIEMALSGGERARNPDEFPIAGVLQPGAALARAEELAERRTEGTPRQRAEALIRIGDAHYALGRRASALRVYAKAVALLDGIGAAPPFDQPAFVAFQVPRPAPLQGPDGYALAEFRVDSNGRTREVRIVEVQPTGLPASVSASLVSALRAARLRPRIVKGEPQLSSGVRFRLPVRGGSAP